VKLSCYIEVQILKYILARLNTISVIHEEQMFYTNVMNVNYYSPKNVSKLSVIKTHLAHVFDYSHMILEIKFNSSLIYFKTSYILKMLLHLQQLNSFP